MKTGRTAHRAERSDATGIRIPRIPGTRNVPGWLGATPGFLFAILLILTFRWWFQTGLVDDALILARYAKNLVDHGELSFNLGQRVEGYTSFLWVFLASALAKLGLPPDQGVVLLSVLAGCMGAGLLALVAGRRAGSANGALAALTLLLIPAWTFWAGSGMDSAGFGLLWTISLLHYGRSRFRGTSQRPWAFLGCGVLAAVTAMTRPEGCLLPLVWLIHEWRRGRDWRRLMLSVSSFALVFGIYLAWRWHYFGYPLPNTFYAKVGGLNPALVLRGAKYFGLFLLRLSPLLLAAALIWSRGVPTIQRWRQRGGPAEETNRSREWPWADWTHLLTWGAALLALLGIVAVGGDHFPLDRFGVHLLPSLLCLIWIVPDWSTGRRWKPAALLAGAALSACACWTELPRFFTETDLARDWRRMGQRLGEILPADASVATYFVGAIGYDSGLTVWDMQGIVDAHIAHEKRSVGHGYTGHEKYDSAYILSRKPDVILLQYDLQSTPKEPADPAAGFWGAAAKDLYRQTAFRQEYLFAAVPLGDAFIHLYRRKM